MSTSAQSEADTHKVLIVGASGGIGAAMSQTFATRGSDVTELSQSREGFDITDQNSVDRHMKRLTGPYHAVIIASGILAPAGRRPEKSLAEIDAAQMAHVFAVNTIGPALVLRHLPRLLPARGRSVVGVLTARVGSIGDNQLGGWYSYRAAKAAANQIVHTAAIEIARTRKQAIVVALHPGTVDTAFTRNYPGHAKAAPDERAANLLSVLDGLAPADTGGFFDWAGESVPW